MVEASIGRLYPAKYAIVLVFGLAILAAVGGLWYSANLQRRPIWFWGARQAALVVRAPRVELLKLVPAAESPAAEGSEYLEIAGHRWRVAASRDVTGAKGLYNVRNALVNDYSFDWSTSIDVSQAQWRYALRFRDADRQTTAAFDPDQKAVYACQSQSSASLAPALAGVDGFVRDTWNAGRE